MHALALVIALAPALALASARDRAGYEREIDSNQYNLVPNLQSFILSDDVVNRQKNKGNLITKPLKDSVVDDLVVDSNVLQIILSPARQKAEWAVEDGPGLVRQRRGYNLENVRVPARYPYLPVPSYNRFRRWG